MLVALLLIATTTAIFILYLKWRRTYWTRRGVEQLQPSLLFGDLWSLVSMSKSFFDISMDVYNQFKKCGVPYGGIYSLSEEIFVVIDPDLIKRVCISDFDYFTDHGTYSNEKVEPLTGHLFNLEGARWKYMRQKLTPTFTSGKMKMMFQTFLRCTSALKDILDEVSSSGKPIEIKDLLARFTTDIIANCAFGIDCNCIQHPDSEFRLYGKKIFTRKGLDTLKIAIMRNIPFRWVKYLGLRFIASDVEKFFLGMVKDNAEYREKNNVFRKDFFHLMLQLKNQGVVSDDETIVGGNDKSGLSLNEVAAQCFVFFIAGFETSSSTMSFALYELATNQDVQDKARESIEEVLKKYDGQMTYEAVHNMTYLENVIKETLRKYPVAPILPRKCSKNYKVPNSDVIIEKGTRVWIPVSGLHRDSKFYANPDQFYPDRFTEESQASRPSTAFLPFGEGPRQCIGLRFGLLQSKLGLATIIRNFRVTLNNSVETPLKLKAGSFVTTPAHGVLLEFQTV